LTPAVGALVFVVHEDVRESGDESRIWVDIAAATGDTPLEVNGSLTVGERLTGLEGSLDSSGDGGGDACYESKASGEGELHFKGWKVKNER